MLLFVFVFEIFKRGGEGGGSALDVLKQKQNKTKQKAFRPGGGGVEHLLESIVKQQTENKTNFRFRPGGEGGSHPFASNQKRIIKKRSLCVCCVSFFMLV